MSEFDQLPPRQQGVSKHNENDRLYRTALGTRDYLKLEVEAMERGIKPFGLTKHIMTLYINRKLILKSDLSTELQEQIEDFYKKTAKTL